MKMRFMDIHKGNDYHSLNQLNDDLNKWISEYNRTLHSSLKEDENDNHSPLNDICYKSQDNLTNLLQLSVLSFFRI